MSVFDRLETLLRSEWNARRPGQRFGDDLADDLRQARMAMNRLSSDEQLLERRIQQSRSEVRYRQAEAERAVQQGDELRAKNELRQRIHEEQRLESMERDWHEMRRRIDGIQDTLRLAEQQMGGAPYDRQQAPSPPAVESPPGASYYRSLSDGSTRLPRSERRGARSSATSRPFSAPTRQGAPNPHRPLPTNRPGSDEASSDPFERFDDMEANLNRELSRDEANAELSGDLLPPSSEWSDDPLADPLDATFDELESEQNLKRLKESSGRTVADREDDPLKRLKDRLQKGDKDD